MWFVCTVDAITDHTVILRHVKSDDEAPGQIEFQLTGANCSFRDFPEDKLIESGLRIEFPQPPLDVPQKVPRPNFRVLIFVPPPL